jgi:hypothetical protein
VDHPYFLEKYNAEFDRLWENFAMNAVDRKQNEAAAVIQNSYRNKGG